MRFTINITYDIITNESAKMGDVAESGYELIDHICENLRELVTICQQYGCYYDEGANWLYSADPSLNYVTGESTSYAVHIKDMGAANLHRLALLAQTY